ncbi:MAG TPA: adenosylcobinamide-phosphate synthase CbiB [Nocardioides sp.]|nr:adenosylcobinamide-phosphate synthase CbiB [Nocardioides sp.]
MSVVVAGALDLTLGEPPARLHPVVAIGRYLSAAERLVPARPAFSAMTTGAAAWVGGALAVVAVGRLVERAADRRGRLWGSLVRGVALWPLLSARLLLAEVQAVESSLGQGTEAGRSALARIVSRDTGQLRPEEVRAAAIESLSENLSDSLVAPLFWYLLAGIPGAALYRFANTADACWGYRSGRWEYAGRVAARADDALNLLPARLTALLLHGGSGWPELRREAGKTSSPNAGWPMAAMALRLGLRLTKRGHYALNPVGAPPGPGDVTEAVRAGRRTALVAVAVAAASEGLARRHRGASR